MKIPIVSLFSGCGGLDLGFAQEGHFKTVLAVDADNVAISTYKHNLRRRDARVGDLHKLDGEGIVRLLRAHNPPTNDVRGVIGGPPCQPFSNGNRSGRDDDHRVRLPARFAAILKVLNDEFQLDFFLFENVRGLSYGEHRAIFSRFKRQFEGAGFNLYEGLVDAVDFGVPQRRPRVFVVGFNKQRFEDWDFVFPTGNRDARMTVADAIGGLPKPVFYSRGLEPEDIPFHPNHWTMVPRSAKFKDGTLKKGQSGGRSFRVLAWSRQSWTVAYGNREIHIHPSGKRRLSVLEAMLLQGFPEDYELLGSFSDQIRQICDAVPPPLARALARQIRLFLEGSAKARAQTRRQLKLF